MISGHNLLGKLQSAYDEAEAAVKQYERLTLSCPVAAINQLRYAGFHLLKAVGSSREKNAVDEHMAKAVAHCDRAKFDAIEGVLYSQLEFIADFQNLCRNRKDVQSVYSDYATDYQQVADMQHKLQSMGPIQLITEADISELLGIVEAVGRLKYKILKHKLEVERLERSMVSDSVRVAAQQFLVPFIATVVGTVVGLLGFVVAIWPSLPPSLMARLLILGVICGVGWFGVWLFFRWSVRNMLSGEQREVLTAQYGLRL